MQKEILGPDHPHTVLALANLASSYSDMGQYQQGMELSEQVLEMRREILGPDHPDTVSAMANLASSYSDLGQYQQAMRLEEQVLKMRTQFLGHEHPDTLLAMWNLAVTLQRLEKKEDLQQLLLVAVPIYEKVQGVNNSKTATLREWLNNVVDTSL